MTSVTILGGSLAGLSAALMLARAGHDVTVLERDPQPLPPELDSAADWDRPTVPQTQHAQSVLALGRGILARRLPDVLADLLAAGAGEYPLVPDPASQQASLGVRRTTLEWVLRRAALQQPGIRWRGGVLVTDLLWRRAGAVPQVVGVRTRGHGHVRSDLVLDATGRRSRLPGWLRTAGVELAELDHNCELIAHSRFYRLREGVPAPSMLRGNATIVVLDGFGCYAFLADNRTIAVALGRLPEDRHLARLQEPACFDAVAAGVRAIAPLVDPDATVPISGVQVMAGVRNIYRNPLREGSAQVHGMHAIGDALATTNPAFGRGVSLAFAHAEAVVDALAAEPERADRQADLIARRLTALTLPVWQDTVGHDKSRIHQWRSTLRLPVGAPPVPPAVPMVTGVLAGMVDADIAARIQRGIQLLDNPLDVFGSTTLAARIARLTLPDVPPMGSRAQAVHALDAVSRSTASSSTSSRLQNANRTSEAPACLSS